MTSTCLESESVATFPCHTLQMHATTSGPNEALHSVCVQLVLNRTPQFEWLIETERSTRLSNGANLPVLYHAMEVPNEVFLAAGQSMRYHGVIVAVLGEGQRPPMAEVVRMLETLRDVDAVVQLADNNPFRA
jgi:hypothetical protein